MPVKKSSFEVNDECPKNLHDLQSDYHSHQKEWKLLNAISLYAICMIKKLCSSHEIFKTSIRSWSNIKECAQSNPV